jgi:hypothetical protein
LALNSKKPKIIEYVNDAIELYKIKHSTYNEDE